MMTGCRLPIQDPQYRYPASPNPYWTKLHQFKDIVYSDNETEEFAGSWRNRFPKADLNAPLHVEIGCNAGHVLVEWAQREPGHLYVGIDWKFKAISRAAEKIIKRGLGNALFFRGHAERVQYMFGPEEIDHLYLYFPDPWPKKSQIKNRFLTAENLRLLSRAVKQGGVFHIKTDHPGYFQWMLDAVRESSEFWINEEVSFDLHADHPNPTSLQIPDVTLFERLFIKDGIRIHSLKLRRR